MKANSVLGILSQTMLEIAKDKTVDIISARVRIKAADVVIRSEATQMNNQLQYDRIKERKSRLPDWFESKKR